ncbi:MAG: hypothetical protein ABS935_03120 [Solibacillus sp.]|uniref:hypothetical protein n=1 Tax=Solibacillus sp. TaxID=1909654 RepID=UPI0033159132
MEQRKVDFNLKSFFLKDDYIKAGSPVMYFEFNKSEYYGLVAVRKDYSPENNPLKLSGKEAWQRAIETYIETVCGDDEEAIEAIESYPKEISKSEALLKFMLASEMKSKTVGEVIEQFELIENGLVLVDGSLI